MTTRAFSLFSLPLALFPLIAGAPALGQTVPRVSSDPRLTLEAPAAQPAPVAPANAAAPRAVDPVPTVAGTYVDEKTGESRPIRLRADFAIRSEPEAHAEKLATVRSAVGEANLRVLGMKVVESEDGKKQTWIKVKYHDDKAWISGDALVDKDSVPLLGKSDDPPKRKGPECFTTLREMRANPRFKEVLKGNHPFGRWIYPGPLGMDATLDVFPDGHTIVNHPTKGQMNVTVSLCLDRNNRPYGTYNGAVFYFDGPALHTAQIMYEGSAYTFTRTAQ